MKRADQLRALRDPNYAAHMALMEVLSRVQTLQGNEGYTPVKGVDYFTPDEIVAMCDYIRSLIPDGRTPQKGIDYFDGKHGKTPVKGVDYFDGNHGQTPAKGIDYWTPADRAAIVDELVKKVKGKDGTSPKMEEIIAAAIPVLREELRYENIKNAPDLKDLPELIAFLRRGGFRGGGGSTGGTGVTPQRVDLSSQCNGSNTVFTIGGGFTTILSLIGSDAPIIYRPVVDFSEASPNITLTAAVNPPSNGATLVATYV